MNDRYGDKYRVYDWVKFDYSEIGEYVDENHTDRPLRNDELVNLLNNQNKRIIELEDELEKLQTFKKILEYGEKSVDNGEWERYIEKEFKGL